MFIFSRLAIRRCRRPTEMFAAPRPKPNPIFNEMMMTTTKNLIKFLQKSI